MKEVRLDPRTKMFLLLMVSTFILGGVGGSRMWLSNIVLCHIPLLLLTLQKKFRTAFLYIVLYGLGLLVHRIMILYSTVLIIAHRMRTVANADKIVVLKDGVVAEQGVPEELEKIGGIYANMKKVQMKSSEWRM